ncbi:MAG: hypothetical protein ABSE77_04880 [Acidimicrobiales bacterium]
MADEAGWSSATPGTDLPRGLAEVYYCAGLRVSSPLPLAARMVDGPADVVVVRGEDRPVPGERPSEEVIAERVVDGCAWYTFAQRGEEVVGRFYGLADFEIDGSGQRVTYYRDPAARDLVAILIPGSLVAYLLSSAGRLVLHASAVEVDGAALAFVGFSGQGKTTVATLLCAEGYPLVTDDLLPVDTGPEGVTCAPAGIELRVREKVEALLERFSSGAVRGRTLDDRHAVAPLATSAERLRLAALVIPWPDRAASTVSARRLPPGEAALLLARCQRIEGWTAPSQLRAQFKSISAVVASVPVFEMQVPWGPPFPTTLAEQVVAAVRAEPAVVPGSAGIDA